MPVTDIAILQTKYDLLMQKVAKMRTYQRDYFLHRCSTDLYAAKKYEREVDTLIKAEQLEKTNPQKTLFNA